MSKEVKYVQPLLFPPHLTYFHPQPSNHIFTEVQNWSYRNIMYDHILPLQDALLHFFQPRLPHRLLQRRLIPTSIPEMPYLLSCDTAGHHMLKPPRPSRAGGNYPRIGSEDDNRLIHNFKQCSRHPHICAFPSQDP